MMNKTEIKYLVFAAALLGLASCESENVAEQAEKGTVTFDASRDMHSDIVPFVEDGAPQTRANFAGDQFEVGDLIKIRIVAPFTSTTEWGEYTDGNSHDNFWILQWNGEHANWRNVPGSKENGMADGLKYGFDLNGDFKATGSSNIWTLSQGTPYVFTASTWTEEIHSIVSPTGQPGGTIYTWFNSVFKADQRELSDYKSSDVLWAQQIMQTGPVNVHLSFEHKMSALCIDVSNYASEFNNTDEIVVTVENMPDIDQQEIVVGNYYAGAIKGKGSDRAHDSQYYRPDYGDWQRTGCSKVKNGTVLGISKIVESSKTVEKVKIEACPQTATYTAYKGSDNKFYLIIPPYKVPTDVTPTVWLRQGTKRWSAPLTLPADRTFVPSTRYTVTLKPNN